METKPTMRIATGEKIGTPRLFTTVFQNGNNSNKTKSTKTNQSPVGRTHYGNRKD
jgi:hypothetical protein